MLSEIEHDAILAIKLAGQTSGSRRRRSSKSIAQLVNVKMRLDQFLQSEPKNVRGWELLSNVEEALLSFSSAMQSIQRILELTSERKHIKRLAMLRARVQELNSLNLDEDDIGELKEYLSNNVAKEGHHQIEMVLTVEWLKDNCYSEANLILDQLRHQGNVSDVDVLQFISRT